MQSWQLGPDGAYRRLDRESGDFSAHTWFMTNPSLSGRGSALRESRPAMPGELFPETSSGATAKERQTWERGRPALETEGVAVSDPPEDQSGPTLVKAAV